MKRAEVWWASLPPPPASGAFPSRWSSELKLCVVNLDLLVTIPKAQLTERIALLRPEKIDEVETAIRFALGLRS